MDYHKVRQALLEELPDAPAKHFDGVLTKLLKGETVPLNWRDQQGNKRTIAFKWDEKSEQLRSNETQAEPNSEPFNAPKRPSRAASAEGTALERAQNREANKKGDEDSAHNKSRDRKRTERSGSGERENPPTSIVENSMDDEDGIEVLNNVLLRGEVYICKNEYFRGDVND